MGKKAFGKLLVIKKANNSTHFPRIEKLMLICQGIPRSYGKPFLFKVNLPHQDDTSLDRKESTDSEDLEHTARRLFQGLVTPAERQKLQRRLGQDPDFRRAYHKVRRERSLLRNTWTFIKNATKAPFSRSRKASKFLSPRRLRFLFGSVKKKRK